jgi:site-specific recombinase XerD
MKTDSQKLKLFFSMTLEFLETYLPRQCGRSPLTVESYRDALSLFRRYVVDKLGVTMGSFAFAACNRDCVMGFMEYLTAKKSKPGTRNQRLAVLKSYLSFAADRDITLQSVALEVGRIPQFRQTKTERVVIPDEAMAAILRQPQDTKKGLRDRTFMVMLYDSGARLAEIIGLKVSDVMLDGENPYIRINGKGGKQRIVPISVKAVTHLMKYLTAYHKNGAPGETELLFYTVIKGTAGQMSEGNVERFVKEYATEARLSCPSIPMNVHPHMFRRTRATQLYRNGVDLPLVSRLLGHARLETTQLYASPSLKMLRDAITSVETPELKAEKPLWEGNEDLVKKLNGLR